MALLVRFISFIHVILFLYSTSNLLLILGSSVVFGIDIKEKAYKAYAEINHANNSSNSGIGNFPYLLDYSSLVGSNSSASNSGKEPTSSSNNLGFISWGNGNLHLSQIPDEKRTTLLRIEGSTKDDGQGAGLVSRNLDFKGRYVLLYTGNIAKPDNAKLSFSFAIKALQKEYHLIFVDGSLNIQGWHNRNYYENINAESLKLIDLKKLLAPYTDNYTLERVIMVIPKGISISADFQIYLDSKNATIVNTGHVQHDRYILHDLTISRLIDVNYQVISTSYDVVENGWIITNIKQWRDNTGLINTQIIAKESSIPLSESIYKLDIPESILNLGSKDLIFLFMIFVPVLVYPYRMVRS